MRLFWLVFCFSMLMHGSCDSSSLEKKLQEKLRCLEAIQLEFKDNQKYAPMHLKSFVANYASINEKLLKGFHSFSIISLSRNIDELVKNLQKQAQKNESGQKKQQPHIHGYKPFDISNNTDAVILQKAFQAKVKVAFEQFKNNRIIKEKEQK